MQTSTTQVLSNVTLVELLALQPAAVVTVTDNVAMPVFPAVQVMVRVFCPEMIVPPMIVQL